MRALIGALVGLFVLGAGVSAQDNEAKYNEKLKKEFVSQIEWTQSLKTAMKQASKGNKLIFGYFTRSYSP